MNTKSTVAILAIVASICNLRYVLAEDAMAKRCRHRNGGGGGGNDNSVHQTSSSEHV